MAEGVPTEELAAAHRQVGWMFIFTVGLVLFLIAVDLAAMPLLSSLIVLLIPIGIASIPVAWGFIQRKSWGLGFMLVSWFGLTGIVGILAVVDVGQGITTDRWALVQAALLLFLTWSMFQRTKLLRHPMFAAWYHGHPTTMLSSIPLAEGEMLASCPHCSSLLAIQPEKLGVGEKCPNCHESLVLKQTIDDLNEEE
jgi:fucose 4-O-acetylase-like acetyltransferase